MLFAARGTSDHAALYAKYLTEIQLGLPAGLASPSTLTVYGSRPDLSRRAVRRGEPVRRLARPGRLGYRGPRLRRAHRGRHQRSVLGPGRRPPSSASTCTPDPSARSPRPRRYTPNCSRCGCCWSGRTARPRCRTPPRRRWLTGGRDAAAPRYRFADRLITTARGYSYPTAREAALKLMETSYVSAQAFSAADLLHGPLAMIDSGIPVIAVVSPGRGGAAMSAALDRLDATGADVLRVGPSGDVPVSRPTASPRNCCRSWRSCRCSSWPGGWRWIAAPTPTSPAAWPRSPARGEPRPAADRRGRRPAARRRAARRAGRAGRAATRSRPAAELLAERLRAGGRVVFVGAGTSGRIAVAEAAELPGTFGLDRARRAGPGRRRAAQRAPISDEDDLAGAQHDLAELAITAADVLVAVAASGSTPYTLLLAEQARAAGAAVIAVVNVAASPLAAVADVAIEVEVGRGGAARLDPPHRRHRAEGRAQRAHHRRDGAPRPRARRPHGRRRAGQRQAAQSRRRDRRRDRRLRSADRRRRPDRVRRQRARRRPAPRARARSRRGQGAGRRARVAARRARRRCAGSLGSGATDGPRIGAGHP